MSDSAKFPKPAKRPPKSRQPIRRSTSIERKSWGVKRKAGGTAHSRRTRELGFMMFCRGRGCELARDVDLQRVLGISHDCSFERVEFAHLSDLKRYDPAGDIGAGLCHNLHSGLDGNRIGGKPAWYVAMDRQGQHNIRMRLANRARMAWEALSAEERAEWDRKAEAWRASNRRS